jgi:3-hydroxyacyl-CoA dehydrogenase
MCDLSSSALENGRKIIQSSLTRIAAKRPELGGSAEKQEAWIQDVLSRVRDTTDGGEGVGKADLVVEVSSSCSPATLPLWFFGWLAELSSIH